MSPAFEFQQLMEKINACAKDHGWWEDEKRNFGEIVALCHSELSEALEEYRNGMGLDHIYYVKDKEGKDKPEGVPVEFADVLIRLFDVCEQFNIPLYQALLEKMSYNEGRPYRHGGKKA